MRCHASKTFFTLYPPGYRPYARELVAPSGAVGEDGSLLGTVIATAQGARTAASRRTSRRCVQWVARALGVDDWRQRSRLARLLGLGVLALRDLRQAWRAAQTLAGRAAALLGTLRGVFDEGGSVAERLIGAATAVGLVGESYRCDRDAGGLRPLFR